MPNLQNLMNIEDVNARRTQDERREYARKAGKASGEARRKKKTIKDTINLLLTMPVFNDKMKKQMVELGYTDEELTNQTALVLAIYKRALTGDVNAFNTIADRSGEVITQKIEKTDVPIIKDDV